MIDKATWGRKRMELLHNMMERREIHDKIW